MTTRKALVTGITGQDGFYLSRMLLEKGYEVHGLVRWHAMDMEVARERLAFPGAPGSLTLHQGDITDLAFLARLLGRVGPDEIYNLAAITPVPISFDNPDLVTIVNAVGPLRLLEAIRLADQGKHARFFQASTSEVFGKVREVPQTEQTGFHPRSPYAIAKAHAHWMTANYRDAYDLHASNGLMFNHESPLRGRSFVTRKITSAIAAILAQKLDKLALGNMSAERDWGHARDYMEAAWLMMQQDTPDDYVIASGETHTVREFTTIAFAEAGIEIKWEGEGAREIGRDRKTGATLVEVNRAFFRPVEDDTRRGDASKAMARLGWRPRTSFRELIREMVHADLALAGCGLVGT